MKIVHVCANPKPTEESVSKQLATHFFATLVTHNPEIEIHNVDLYQDKPPYLSYEGFRAAWYPVFQEGYELSKEEEMALTYARRQAEELVNADVLIVTTPMWNFTVPAILKAWIDQMLTPGIMFEMTAQGPRPLHSIKKIIMLVASGGVYKEDDPRDALSAVVRNAFGFVGVSDVEIAWADAQNPMFFDDAEEHKQWAMEAAEEIAEELAQSAPAEEVEEEAVEEPAATE